MKINLLDRWFIEKRKVKTQFYVLELRFPYCISFVDSDFIDRSHILLQTWLLLLQLPIGNGFKKKVLKLHVFVVCCIYVCRLVQCIQVAVICFWNICWLVVSISIRCLWLHFKFLLRYFHFVILATQTTLEGSMHQNRVYKNYIFKGILFYNKNIIIKYFSEFLITFFW